MLGQIKWAAAWQNLQSYTCAQQRQISLRIRPIWSVFHVRSLGSSRPKDSSCGQQRLWSDWADAQADLSLRWAHVVLLFLSCCGSNLDWHLRTKRSMTSFSILFSLFFFSKLFSSVRRRILFDFYIIKCRQQLSSLKCTDVLAHICLYTKMIISLMTSCS